MIDNPSQIEIEEEMKKETARKDLRSVFIMITIMTGFCLLFSSHFAFGWDYKIIIIYSSIVQFTLMVQKLIASRSYYFELSQDEFQLLFQCGREHIDNSFIAIVYSWEVAEININFISYALLILQFLMLAITVLISRNAMDQESLEQTKQIQEILIAAVKSIASLQVVFVTLKWTQQINWGWLQTFIIMWFTLGTLLIIDICLLVDLLMKCFDKPNPEVASAVLFRNATGITVSNLEQLGVHGSAYLHSG